jgi:hypothetical protein
MIFAERSYEDNPYYIRDLVGGIRHIHLIYANPISYWPTFWFFDIGIDLGKINPAQQK